MSAGTESALAPPRKEHHRFRLASLGDVSRAVKRVCHRLDRLMIHGKPTTHGGKELPAISTEDYLAAARCQVYALKVLGDLIHGTELERRVKELEDSARARAS